MIRSASIRTAVDSDVNRILNNEIPCPLWEDADSLPDAQLVPPQVKPQQQSSGSSSGQSGSTVPGPSPIGAGQSPIGHPPVSLQGPLSPPPFNSTGQPSHINYQVIIFNSHRSLSRLDYYRSDR